MSAITQFSGRLYSWAGFIIIVSGDDGTPGWRRGRSCTDRLLEQLRLVLISNRWHVDKWMLTLLVVDRYDWPDKSSADADRPSHRGGCARACDLARPSRTPPNLSMIELFDRFSVLPFFVLGVLSYILDYRQPNRRHFMLEIFDLF